MVTTLAISLGLLVSLVAICSLIGTLVGLPGNWVTVATALLIVWLVPKDWTLNLPAWSVVAIVLLALAGEAIEFIAGALGVGKTGGAKRSAALAVVGSIVGAIVGMFIGVPIIPIPLLGSLIVSVLLSGVGASVGAALGERWVGKDWDGSVQVGIAAFWGRLFGTLGKGMCGAVMTAFFLYLCWT